mgnify:CR=1 FL=1
MKSLAIAMLLGGTTSKQLNDVSNDIWDESTESYYNVCADPWPRWADSSNSWNTFKTAFQSGSVYQDSDFKADMSSIYANNARPQSAYQLDQRVVGWKRPKDIYPGEEVHLKGTQGLFAPTGIKQGGLGDCWFLAGVTALAEDPERLN